MATDVISNDLPQTLPVVLPPAIDHLVTEDDTPVDSFFSEKQLRLLTEPLYSSRADWAGQRSFIAAANVGLFFVARNPAIGARRASEHGRRAARRPPSQESSVVFSLGIRQAAGRGHRSGFQPRGRRGHAEAGGLRPGPRALLRDLRSRSAAQSGSASRLPPRSAEYRRMDEPIEFPDIGLGLRLWQGRYEGHDNTWLRWVDADGVPIPTGQERRRPSGSGPTAGNNFGSLASNRPSRPRSEILGIPC